MSKALNRLIGLIVKQNVLITNKRLFTQSTTNCSKLFNRFQNTNKFYFTPKPQKLSLNKIFVFNRDFFTSNNSFNNNRGMPPIGEKNFGQVLNDLISQNKVVIFSKTTCPFCTKVYSLYSIVDQLFKFHHFLRLSGEGTLRRVKCREIGGRVGSERRRTTTTRSTQSQSRANVCSSGLYLWSTHRWL